MITYTELVIAAGPRETERVSGIPTPLFQRIARALKVVLAADGVVDGAELNAYLETCRRFGAPDAIRSRNRSTSSDVDPRSATVVNPARRIAAA